MVDVSILQRFQDWFSATSGIPAIIRDIQGRPVTKASESSRFCQLVMGTECGHERCRLSNHRACREAVVQEKPIKYVCHAGMTQIAAPIEVQGHAVGTIVMGDRPVTSLSPEKIEQLAAECGIEPEELYRSASELRRWSDEKMREGIGFLQMVASTLARICYQGQEARSRLEELIALHEVSTLLTSTLDLQKILNTLARKVTELLNVKGCSIRLLDRTGKELVIKSFYNLSKRYRNKGPLLVERSSIDRSAMRGKAVQITDMRNDPRVVYPKDAEEERIFSGLAVGLISKKRPVGTIHVYSSGHHVFRDDEIRLLRSLANHAAAAIENARLYQESLERKELVRELMLAGEIQERLLPDSPPPLDGFEMEAKSTPCRAVGGDFYDFITLGQDRVAIVIADVSGKGIPGALLMATARAALRAEVQRGINPSAVMRHLNVTLCQDTKANQFVSLFFAILNTQTGYLTYTNAGLNPPFRLRRGAVATLGRGGIVLGADENSDFERGRLKLKSGDVVVFYTDGVTDAVNQRLDVFGKERLLEVARLHSDGTAKDILLAVKSALQTFSRGQPQYDDITIIVLKTL